MATLKEIINQPEKGQPRFTPREGVGARFRGYEFTDNGWKKLPSEQETKTEATKTEQVSQPEPRNLPQNKKTNLSSFDTLLSEITNRVTKQGRGEAFKETSEAIGFEPKGSGPGTLESITNFVKGEIGSGAKGMYESTINLLEEQQKQAGEQVDRLINEKALPEFSDVDIKQIAQQAGVDESYLLAIKKSQEKGGTDEDKFGELTSSRQSDAVQNFLKLDQNTRKAIYYWFNKFPEQMSVDKINEIMNAEDSEDLINKASQKAGDISDQEYRNFLKNNVSLSNWVLSQESGVLGVGGTKIGG